MIKRSSRLQVKKELPHLLDGADMLSSNAWMKWDKKQENHSKRHNP
jgi:hypothetical protein